MTFPPHIGQAIQLVEVILKAARQIFHPADIAPGDMQDLFPAIQCPDQVGEERLVGYICRSVQSMVDKPPPLSHPQGLVFG